MKALVRKVELGPFQNYLHLLSFIIGFWAFYLVEVDGESLPQKLSISKVISVPDSLKKFSLECPSQAPNSTLVLWILHGAHVVIGSAGATVDNNKNHNKFLYIKSTGELQINDVSWEDAGIYRCVVQFLSPDYVNESSTTKLERYLYDTSAIELRVRESYNNSWDQKYKNLIRALMAAGAALLIFAISCTVHSFRWRKPDSSNLNENFSSSSENLNICEEALKWESNQGRNPLSGLDSSTDHFSRKNQKAYGTTTKVFVIPDPPPFHIENIRTSHVHGIPTNFDSHKISSTMMMLKPLNSEEYGDDVFAEDDEMGKSSTATKRIPMLSSSTTAQQGSNNYNHNDSIATFPDYDWQKYWASHRNSTDTDGNTTAPIASPESESSVITGETEGEQNAC